MRRIDNEIQHRQVTPVGGEKWLHAEDQRVDSATVDRPPRQCQIVAGESNQRDYAT